MSKVRMQRSRKSRVVVARVECVEKFLDKIINIESYP